MNRQAIPLVILAGADRRPAKLPEQGRDKHPLVGYKSVDVRIEGKTLIENVVDRLEASGGFAPIYIAGPRHVYEEYAGNARLIHTDGTFGQNVQASVEHIRADSPDSPIGFTVCDILPESRALDRLLSNYAEHAPCDLWAPMVRSPKLPEKLGASAWKPAYGIIPENEEAPVRVLPGHLVVGDPRALRLKFVYRLIDLGYSTRNRSIDYRRGQMTRGILANMLMHDLRLLARLRLPTFTWSVLRAVIPAANLLRQGTITQRRLEETTRRVFVKQRHRWAYPDRRVVVPIVDALSMARDIDTEEEAAELGGNVRH
jgi:hypothetical protein